MLTLKYNIDQQLTSSQEQLLFGQSVLTEQKLEFETLLAEVKQQLAEVKQQLASKEKELDAHQTSAETRISSLSEQIEDLRSTLLMLQEERAELSNSLEDQEELSKLRGTYSGLQKEMNKLEEDNNKLLEMIHGEKTEKKMYEDERRELSNQISDLQLQCSTLKETSERAEEITRAEKDKTVVANKQFEEINQRMMELLEKIQTSETKQEQIAEELKEMVRMKDNLGQVVNNLEARLQEKDNLLREQQGQMAEQEKLMDRLEEEFAARKALEQEVGAKKIVCLGLEKRLSHLETERADLQSKLLHYQDLCQELENGRTSSNNVTDLETDLETTRSKLTEVLHQSTLHRSHDDDTLQV